MIELDQMNLADRASVLCTGVVIIAILGIIAVLYFGRGE